MTAMKTTMAMNGLNLSSEPCSIPGIIPNHVHIKVGVEEKQGKHKVF